MIRARVDVRARWGAELAKRVNDQVRDAVDEASRVGAEAASSASSSRRRTGKMGTFRAVQVRGTADGWEGGFKSAAFYSGMQSRGTRKGVTPLRHEEKGLAVARKHLIARLNRL